MAENDKGDHRILPEPLIDAIGLAVHSGLTADQIGAVLTLTLMLMDMADVHDPTCLVARCYRVAELVEVEDRRQTHQGKKKEVGDEGWKES